MVSFHGYVAADQRVALDGHSRMLSRDVRTPDPCYLYLWSDLSSLQVTTDWLAAGIWLTTRLSILSKKEWNRQVSFHSKIDRESVNHGLMNLMAFMGLQQTMPKIQNQDPVTDEVGATAALRVQSRTLLSELWTRRRKRLLCFLH